MPLSPDARRLSLIASALLGSGLAWHLSRADVGRSQEGTSVPIGKRIDQRGGSTPSQATGPGPDRAPDAGLSRTPRGSEDSESTQEIACEVPPPSELPKEHRVTLVADPEPSPSGGAIAPGHYRLISATTDDPEEEGGVWTFSLDLAPKGQGAFHRQIGLSASSSRISYQTAGARLTFEVLCPEVDHEKWRFYYSVTPEGLRLLTDDRVVLTLERFGDSAVEGLPPPRELPQGKMVLPPRR